MIGKNEEHSFGVITSNGVKPIEEVNIGDKVYEYKTSKLLEVRGIQCESAPVDVVVYSDGRSGMYLRNSLIFNGYAVVNLCDIYEGRISKKANIIQYPIEFNANKVVIPLDPSPYLAGALLMYSDHTKEEISVPLYLNTTYEMIVNMMNDANGLFTKNHLSDPIYPTVNFIYKGDLTETAVTWKDLFHGYKFDATTDTSDRIFPIEYERASIKDRLKFLRGIFDMGYIRNVFPDGVVGIVGNDSKALVEVQKILCSVGILSRIKYDSFLSQMRGISYKLELMGDHLVHPDLFHDVYHIMDTIKDETKALYPTTPNFVDIMFTKNISENGYMYNLILDKPAIYMDSNYLPRVSK